MLATVVALPESTLSLTSPQTSTTTTTTSVVGPYDVLCGRDKEAFNNIGNRRFRVTISLTLDRYKSAVTRKEKSTVIKSVAALVKSNGGKFLHKKKRNTTTTEFIELNEKQTQEKVGHALRDMAMAVAAQTAASSSASSDADSDGEDSSPEPSKRVNSNSSCDPDSMTPPSAKRQKLAAANVVDQQQQQQVEPQQQPNALYELNDDDDDWDDEAFRILSSSIQGDGNDDDDAIAPLGDLLLDDPDNLLSWLMDESDQILDQVAL